MTLFFAMNLATVPAFTWLLVRAFSGGREGMLSAAHGIVRRFLAPAAADTFLADPSRQELGGEIAEVTVLFADLGGFSTYAESRSPAEVVELLNRYFAITLPAILDEGGTPIQLPGDAIMAVFGAPIAHSDHAARACRAARRMVDGGRGRGRGLHRRPALPDRHQHRSGARRQHRLGGVPELHRHRRHDERRPAAAGRGRAGPGRHRSGDGVGRWGRSHPTAAGAGEGPRAARPVVLAELVSDYIVSDIFAE